MSKYALSMPQKLLTGCSFVVFGLGLILVLVISVSAYREAHRPITLAAYSQPPITGSAIELDKGAYFGEVLNQPGGYSRLNWGRNSLFLLGGSTVRIDENSLEVMTGSAFVILSGRSDLVFKDQKLTLSGVSGLFDASRNRFVLMNGEARLSEQETAVANNVILHDGTKFTTAAFDRSELQLNPTWQTLLPLLAEARLLPDSLSDTVPPQLEIFSPQDGAQLTETLLRVTGRTESEAVVSLNSLPVFVDPSGNFTKEVLLDAGNNRLIIEARDSAGNVSVTSVIVTLNTELPVFGSSEANEE